MGVDADVLLAGPRGRGLLVHLIDDVAVLTLIMRADFARRSGSSAMMYARAPLLPGWGLMHRASMRRERARQEREMRRPVAPEELAEAIAAAPVPSIVPAALVEALGRTVDDAKPWQPPDGNEAVAASQVVRAALRPLAGRIAASPFASAWAESAAEQQWTLDRKDDRLGSDPVAAPADALAAWREAIEAEEHAAVKRRERGEVTSGPWWSKPPGHLTHSTSAWPKFGPVGLHLEEDSFGPTSAAATPVGAPPERTYEIADADAWAHLCRQYPMEVTAARENMWRDSVGHSDEWVIPDWQAVAADWHAVHLTIAGYLAAATKRIEVADGRASVIAGWNPDETVWLRGSPTPTSASVEWRCYDHLGWRVAPGDADSL